MLPILLGVGAAVLVLGGLVIGGVVFAVLRMSTSSTAQTGSSAIAVDEPPPGPAAPARLPVERLKEEEVAIPDGPAPNEMAADVVKKVKQSTTYLRVTLPGGEIAQGSGFFALERNLVITNAHVVGLLRSSTPPRRVEVVVRSGEANEAKLTGTLLGVDRENDLAVLRVEGNLSQLPPPLPVASAADLVETQKVYIFGFPFGAQLGKNITVSTSSISSLRRGSDGVLKQVQVNGGMNPGNSGGPVTDARGAVIGVSVAGISGTQINFAIPADFIRPFVQRSKNNPLDLTKPLPGPLARNDLAAGSSLEEDLAALKGTWESGSVGADGGGAMGTVKLSITPQPGNRGGRIALQIATKQGGRTTSSTSNYSFTLEQKGRERILVTSIRRGPRGTARGMVFIYRFEDGQLILAGAIASGRITYTLKNVALRRIAEEPQEAVADKPAPAAPAAPTPAAPVPPVVADKGKASPAATKFSGDVFTFVEEAIREKRLTDVDIRGFTLHQNTYRDVYEKGGLLIGFQVGLGKFVNNDVVKSFRPIFLTKNGEKFGAWHGPAPAAPVTVKAKRGYVVSGLSVRTALAIDALTITFAKLDKDGLDLSDTYESKPIGGNGGRVASIGGQGAIFVGVTGHLGPDGSPSSLGLVAVLPKD